MLSVLVYLFIAPDFFFIDRQALSGTFVTEEPSVVAAASLQQNY